MNAKLPVSRETIRAAVNEYVRRKSISKADLAKRIGVSGATLSNIENENGDTVSDEMLLRVWSYAKPTTWQRVRTANFSTVFAVCEEARAKGRMLGLISSTGYGKTTALRAFEEGGRHVHYIACQKTMRPRQFFQKLLQQMGVFTTGVATRHGHYGLKARFPSP